MVFGALWLLGCIQLCWISGFGLISFREFRAFRIYMKVSS